MMMTDCWSGDRKCTGDFDEQLWLCCLWWKRVLPHCLSVALTYIIPSHSDAAIFDELRYDNDALITYANSVSTSMPTSRAVFPASLSTILPLSSSPIYSRTRTNNYCLSLSETSAGNLSFLRFSINFTVAIYSFLAHHYYRHYYCYNLRMTGEFIQVTKGVYEFQT